LLSNAHSAKDIEAVIDVWKAAQAPLIARWGEMAQELHAAPNGDFAMFSVALRELLDIVQSTETRPDSPPVCLI
jgi:glutamate dehydrogenase